MGYTTMCPPVLIYLSSANCTALVGFFTGALNIGGEYKFCDFRPIWLYVTDISSPVNPPSPHPVNPLPS